MKSVFFGSSIESVNAIAILIKKNFDLKMIVTRSKKPKGRGLNISTTPVEEIAKKYNIDLFNSDNLEDLNFLNLLKNINPDVFIVISYGKLLSEKILTIPKSGTINIHPSLLPLYRGPSPVASAILDGAKETGVSIMLLDKGMDSGPILLQSQPIKLNGEEKKSELSSKLFNIGSNLLTESLKPFLNGNIIPKEQHHESATYTSIIRSSDGEINWHDKAQKIFNLYRAYDDWPGIYTFWNGKRIKLIQVQISSIKLSRFLPGEVKYLDSKLFIGTSTVPIKIDYLQIEGKKIMKSEEFFRGYSSIVDTNLSI